MSQDHASDDDGVAIAEMMGFSSFGTQGSTKKRKFDPSIHAMVHLEDLAELDKGGKRGMGSGGNEIPLGRQRMLGQVNSSLKHNENEVDLGAEKLDVQDHIKGGTSEDDEEREEPRYIDTSIPAPAVSTSAREEDVRTSHQGLLRGGAKAARDSFDNFSEKWQLPNIRLHQNIDEDQQRLRTNTRVPQGLAQYMSTLQSSPITESASSKTGYEPYMWSAMMRHPSPSPITIPEQPVSLEHRSNRGTKNQKNDSWSLDYYDSNFNENPWAQLERSNRLRPQATWHDWDVGI